ncbi:MAG: GNAT family N-acetyltransferase [Tateyamaria sp.]|jgi:putative hemolysin|nr:GNAT family N-acetyltransferase [Tateyamaria sp.]
MSTGHVPRFRVAMANTDEDLSKAQALRYEVFVQELGGSGALVDHEFGLERDCFDPYFDHMLLYDDAVNKVVGVYRMLRMAQAESAGQFYSENAYDLTLLRATGRNLLELGRSCLHADYRGGTAMMHLWSALASYIDYHNIEIMFGVASFHGTDTKALAMPLSLLYQRHLAPEALRVKALQKNSRNMNLIPENRFDRKIAVRQVPALIKGYLRLGGVVGENASVDYAFNTTDVCLVMDISVMNGRQKRIYGSIS